MHRAARPDGGARRQADRRGGPADRPTTLEHNTNLVDTLRAWLDAFGDVIAAAKALYVHPNTFRYRLRRLSEVGGIDLGDAEARFVAMVQLRIVAPATKHA